MMRTKRQSSPTHLRKVVLGGFLDGVKPPLAGTGSAHVTLNVLIACGVFSVGIQSTRAATATEPFDYTIGSALLSQSGGSGWSTAWNTFSGNGTITTEAGSLTYPGIASTGGKMRFTGVPLTGTTTALYRDLTYPLATGSVYVSCLAQNLNDGRRYFGVSLYSGGTEKTLLGQASGNTNWTVNRVLGITNNVAVSTVDSSALALLVLKLEFDTGNTSGFERATFWVNPDLSLPESLATAVNGTNYITDRDFGSITRIRLGGGGYSATAGGDPTDHYLDEVVISSVTPFALPTLSEAVSNGTVILSWPAENLGWNLQKTAALDGIWEDVLNTDRSTSTNLPIALPKEFFRLRNP